MVRTGGSQPSGTGSNPVGAMQTVKKLKYSEKRRIL